MIVYAIGYMLFLKNFFNTLGIEEITNKIFYISLVAIATYLYKSNRNQK